MIELIDIKTMLEKLKAGQIGIDKRRAVKIEYEGKKYLISSTKNYFPSKNLMKKS